MENSWYWPGAIWVPAAAVQVTVRAALVIVVPSSWTGLGSGACLTATFQPGTGLTLTDGKGSSWGSWTCSLTVPAVGDSLGTRKVIWLNEPAAVLSAWTLTWACAATAVAPSRPTESTVIAAKRRRAVEIEDERTEDMGVPSTKTWSRSETRGLVLTCRSHWGRPYVRGRAADVSGERAVSRQPGDRSAVPGAA